MHAQCGIAKQRDVHLVRGVVYLILIHSSVVLRQERAHADRFAKPHMMIKPVRTSGPRSREAITRAQRRAEETAFVVPIAEIAAKKHREHALDVLSCKIV